MKSLFLILLICLFLQIDAQDRNTPEISNRGWNVNQSSHKERKNILLISGTSLYTISLVGLNQLWYADYPRNKFHFINDNGEWLQMDKIGHMSTSYYMGVAGIEAYKWAGFSKKKAIWYGGMTGSIFLTVIEALDGTSEQWGASPGDLIANTTGSILAIGQAMKWNEQRIQLKYSYHTTRWADENPEQLGGNHLERVLKDYNGQTYWLTFNIKSLLNIEDDNFPSWFSLALGYGGECMTEPYSSGDKNAYRQYYVSFDIDLNRIRTKSKVVNSILHTFGFLKFPISALEFSNGNMYFHPIYY